MSDDREEDENVIESEQATAGGPATHDPAGTRRRAETPGMLPPEELDARQKRIRSTRRRGGPDLSKKAPGRSQSDEEPADTPPTETQPPPGPPPPPTP